MSDVKHKPGTDLPWEWLPDEGQFIVTPEPQRKIVAEVPCQGADPQDGAYLVHSANAYPKLVETVSAMLKARQTWTAEEHAAHRLLRDLGEL